MGIAIAAVLTALAALGVYGGVLWLVAPRGERRWLALLLLLQLPVSVGAFYLVRLPLDGLVHGALGSGGLYRALTTLYAPLTEEPAKLWPLLLPPVARRVGRENAARAATALGLGFGLGEIALVARFVAADPSLAALPWYAFGGFLNERFLVCLTHGGFAALALAGWRRWGWGLPRGLLAAMAAHFTANIAIPLARVGPLGDHPALASTLLSLWVVAFWLAALLLLVRLNGALGGSVATTVTAPALFGEATCPSCDRRYARSALALNLGLRRLERCPHCGRWHLLSQFGAGGR